MKYGNKFTYSVDDYLENRSHPYQFDFEGCCGAILLVEFSERVSYKEYKNLFYEYYDEYCDNCEQDEVKPRKMSPDPEKVYLKALTDSIEFCEHLITISILNQYQKQYFPVLKKLGFKLVSKSFINPSSMNKLFVFVRTPKNTRK